MALEVNGADMNFAKGELTGGVKFPPLAFQAGT